MQIAGVLKVSTIAVVKHLVFCIPADVIRLPLRLAVACWAAVDNVTNAGFGVLVRHDHVARACGVTRASIRRTTAHS